MFLLSSVEGERKPLVGSGPESKGSPHEEPNLSRTLPLEEERLFCRPSLPSMRGLLIGLVLSLVSLPAGAQTLWSRPYEPNQFAVEAIIPDAVDEAAAGSGAAFLTGTVSLSDNVELAAELPLSRYQPPGPEGRSTTAIGNPFVGVGLSSTTVPFLLELGLRIPTAPSNETTLIGEAADVGRTAAFQPDALAVSSLLNGRLEIGRVSTLRIRTGIEYGSRPSESPASQNRIQSWRLQYDVQIWREGDRFLTGLTVAGQAFLSSPGTTRHHGALSVMPNWNVVQPGLLVGTSLNDLFRRGDLSAFAGVTLSVSYGRL